LETFPSAPEAGPFRDPNDKTRPFAPKTLQDGRHIHNSRLPEPCRFCPVTPIFGPKIRHRPIDEVVAKVDTLRKHYFNVDDSVFGHP
jgi:hypothetical protein